MAKPKVKTRNYNWRDMVERTVGVEEPIPVYTFSKGNGRSRTFSENPHRPYGPKR